MNNLSTDPRLNVTPDHSAGYLPHLLRYDILNYETERQEFAGKCIREKLTVGQAADRWDAYCREKIKTRDADIERELLKPYEEFGKDVKMSPIEAEAEINGILSDPNHPFHHQNHLSHPRAVLGMKRLQEIKMGLTDNFGGSLLELGKERLERQKNFEPRHSSNGVEEVDHLGQRHNSPPNPESIGFGGQERSSASGRGISDIT